VSTSRLQLCWLEPSGRAASLLWPLERDREPHQGDKTFGLGVVSLIIHKEGKPCFPRSRLLQLKLMGQHFQCTSIRHCEFKYDQFQVLSVCS
jgi:hypothetical protein